MFKGINTFWVKFPVALCLLTLALSFIGIVNIASAAKATRPNLFMVQFVWLLMGVALAMVISFIQTRSLFHIAYPFYVFVILLLVAVFAVGTSAKGSQRWIDLGLMRLQPSELAKLSVVLGTARYCTDFEVHGGYSIRDLIRPFNFSRPLCFLAVVIYALSTGAISEHVSFFANPSSPKTILLFVFLFLVALVWLFLSLNQLQKEGFHLYQLVSLGDMILVPFALILIQPDLGTAMIVLAISGSMILFCGMRTGSLILVGLFSLVVAVVGWNVVLKDYQKQRVESFLNPEADIRGQGYHAAQSMIAIGSGQILGKGFGEGTQTQLSFLPENHTDFVFAVLAEEWGFIGALLVMILFWALVLQMLRVAAKAQDRFGSLLAVGATCVVFWHVFINVGMVTGILPVVGVTLPFVSYGGSSMLTQIAAVGICINVAVWRRIK